MLSSARSPLGAPGVFALPDALAPALHPQRMDACAFIGVAPRGPAYMPISGDIWPGGHHRVSDPARPLLRSVAMPVRSFDEYRRLYGAFEGPGVLPHAVSSFFEQGGRVAWIVRIVHARPGGFGDACARGRLLLQQPFSQELEFIARDEGSWGNGLRIETGFTLSALAVKEDAGSLSIDQGTPLAAGSLLRLTDAGGNASLSFCDGLQEMRQPRHPQSRWLLRLDVAPPNPPVRVELVEAWLAISDGAGRHERFDHLALSPEHPESIATVLCDRSSLAWPAPGWAGSRIRPAQAGVELLRGSATPFQGGEDRYAEIVADDFFNLDAPELEEIPGNGIAVLASVAGVTQVLVPDLYVPAQWVNEQIPAVAQSGMAGAEFSTCVANLPAAPSASNIPPSALTGLILDPRKNSGLEEIVRYQQQVVAFCEETQNLIALLDVPPGLSQARIEQWRARFDSSWAAAYHPWLKPALRSNDARENQRSALRPLPPSSVAAGIIARREYERGIQYGPANEIARHTISLAEPQPEGRADVLHPQHINCFARDPLGIQLLAARTLSRERDWRQLSVRRLILMLRRTLLAEMQWAVFEPNGPALWRDLQHAIENLLRNLFRAGAFAGRTESESYFVHIHTDRWRLERGELLVEIGVAPAEPLEYILLRLRRDGDGTLNLEE